MAHARFTTTRPSTTGEGSPSEAPRPHLTNSFPYAVSPLGSGLYYGPYVLDGGQKIPDGSGTLRLKDELFDGMWTMGTPLNGEYRFANGWKWRGDFSDNSVGGVLHAGGDKWLNDMSFKEAGQRAQDDLAIHSPQPQPQPLPQTLPPSATNETTGSSMAVISTEPGGVAVSFTSSGQRRQQISDADGNLQINLPPGNYHLSCEKAGYQRKECDFSVGTDSSFCRVRLDEDYQGMDVAAGARRAVAAESFPFFLGQVAPDTFAYLIQDRAQKIQGFLRGNPAPQQSSGAREISRFWHQVTQAVLDGYRSDRKNAKLGRKMDGNRRFLEVALGAAAADYASTKSLPSNWGGDYVFPFPKSDGIETATGMTPTSPGTNYFWPVFPQNVLEQSAAANILPRLIKLSLEEPDALGTAPRGAQEALKMVLVPNPKGMVRIRVNEDKQEDRVWSPEAPFYLAASEISFGQMRLYAHWAEQQTSRSPEHLKWFVPVPATKQLVGAQSAPYAGVTIDEALSFCNWLSFCHGREPAYVRLADGSWTQDRAKDGFRVPDEYEWEYAARFGFDFLPMPGAPRWTDIREQLKTIEVGKQPDRRLVYFSIASQGDLSARTTDDAGAWLYPLGVRDMCGNLAELCQAEMTTAETLRWTLCGGHYALQYPGAVMPWARAAFSTDNAGQQTGLRVILPVPMDDFLNE